MDPDLAVKALVEEFVPKTITSLHRRYPNMVQLYLNDDEDVRPPQSLHPAFFGCFDWHSSVHSHWQVVRALRLFPNATFADAARQALNRSFTAKAIAAEVDYVTDRPSFEMPYGMAWLLQLTAELHEWDSAEACAWSDRLSPLEALAKERMIAYLRRLPYPIRSGLHNQTAFAMGLALDWARSTGAAAYATSFEERARTFFLQDIDAPLAYEPSGVDFLSPTLAEADLMRRVLPHAEFVTWLDGFLGGRDLSAHLAPARPVDASDGQLAHFAGLNMSRAWMLRGIASALPLDDERAMAYQELAQQHLESGLTSALDNDYMVAHWAPSFTLYLLSGRSI
mgnify:CR=1 FL=1